MPIVDQVTKRRLSWDGHIKRRTPEDMTRTVLDMEIPGKRPRGRPRIRWMDNIRRDMRLHGLDESMTEDRKVWSTTKPGRSTLYLSTSVLKYNL